MVEGCHSTLEAMLSKFVSKKQKDWNLYLPHLMLATIPLCFHSI